MFNVYVSEIVNMFTSMVSETPGLAKLVRIHDSSDRTYRVIVDFP